MKLNVPEIGFDVIESYPHDRTAFTEGLEFHNGSLYESTGGDKHHGSFSTLRRVELKTGWPHQIIPVHPNHFAEGLTIFGQKLFQLTDKSGLALVYRLNHLKPTRNYIRYKGWDRGWGLTHDDKHLILSDSKQLHFVDPASFEIIRTIDVKDGNTTVEGLNELEYVNGLIYANLFLSNLVLRIDPLDGRILGKIDLGILKPKRCLTCVTNGIAHNQDSGHLYVTGKKWPTLVEIRLI